MPIRPIDLQTLLMKLSQVGREQAVEKEGPLLQSSIQNAASLRRQAETKEALRAPEDPKDGMLPIQERTGKGQTERRRGENDQEGKEAEEASAEEVVRDPDLGANVDLSG
jgi:hypothetical protein